MNFQNSTRHTLEQVHKNCLCLLRRLCGFSWNLKSADLKTPVSKLHIYLVWCSEYGWWCDEPGSRNYTRNEEGRGGPWSSPTSGGIPGVPGNAGPPDSSAHFNIFQDLIKTENSMVLQDLILNNLPQPSWANLCILHVFLTSNFICSKPHKIVEYTLRYFKFSSNKICWSTGIKFTLAESFNKIWNFLEFKRMINRLRF